MVHDHVTQRFILGYKLYVDFGMAKALFPLILHCIEKKVQNKKTL